MKLESSSIKKSGYSDVGSVCHKRFSGIVREVFRMHTLILRGRKYSQMHRLETSY